MSKFKTFLTFVIGAAIGSATTYFLLHKKYESDVALEVQEVREEYKKLHLDGEPKNEEPSDNTPRIYEKTSLDQDKHNKAQASISKPIPTDYTSYYAPEDIEIEEPTEIDEKIIKKDNFKPPYVINPNDFGTIPSYTEMYLVLNPNGSITDTESGEEVEDSEDLLGFDWEGSIGQYEVNTVRVRNERLSIDIEIEQILPQVEKPSLIITASDVEDNPTRKPHEVT